MEYLIWLQNMRGEWSDAEKFFTLFTDGSVAVAMVLISIIFWCGDKRTGKFLLLVYAFSRLLTVFLKNTFCVYRPFILDSNIHPVESAMKSAADSYSFPSGHTNMATATYGGMAYAYGKKFPPIAIFCAAIVLMSAFTRNLLGVHTLQDVLTAIISTALVIVLVGKLMTWLEVDTRRESFLTVFGMILALIAAAYFMLKSYPLDYINGKLIVNPAEAIRDAIGNIGSFVGVLIGLEMERRFVNFKTNVNLSTKIFRVIIGVAIFLALNFLAVPLIKALPLGMATKFLRWFLMNFALTFLIPLIFVRAEKKLFLR